MSTRLRLSTCALVTFALAFTVTTTLWASECFDHYNPEAWHGDGLAMVLCRNHSDSSTDTYITDCEIRHHNGARIQGLSRHGSLDNGRLVYSDYNTTGDSFDFAIDIVCQDRNGTTYTFALANGSNSYTGCCRNQTCGSVSCCGTDCSATPPPPPPPTDAGPPPPDAGDPGSSPPCPEVRSNEYSSAPKTLDVSLGSSTRIRFTIDNVPAPSGLDYATFSMHLYDSDHPGEEGTVYVNGNGPLQLPANPTWDDEDSDAVLAVPVSHLQAGENRIEFGAGTLDRTHYDVSRVALQVYGPACAPEEDQDAGGTLGDPPSADSGMAPPDGGESNAGSGGWGIVEDGGSQDEASGGAVRAASEPEPEGCTCSLQNRSPKTWGAWLALVLWGALIQGRRRSSAS